MADKRFPVPGLDARFPRPGVDTTPHNLSIYGQRNARWGKNSGAPKNTTAPAITGTATAGQTLTCDDGVWTGSPVLSKQWTKDGIAIPGALGNTYVIKASDVGHAIGCAETGSNANGALTVLASGGVTPAMEGDEAPVASTHAKKKKAA